MAGGMAQAAWRPRQEAGSPHFLHKREAERKSELKVTEVFKLSKATPSGILSLTGTGSQVLKYMSP